MISMIIMIFITIIKVTLPCRIILHKDGNDDNDDDNNYEMMKMIVLIIVF